MSPEQLFLIYFFAVSAGAALEGLLFWGHKKITGKPHKVYHFKLVRFLVLLFWPLLATFLVFQIAGWELVKIFITFSLVGTFLEWCLGFSYEQVVGQKLWTYHRFPISGHTSFLSIPFWGVAGVMFWLLIQVFR